MINPIFPIYFVFQQTGTGAQAVHLSGLMNQTPTKRRLDARDFFLRG
jgi:hypothetical protein